VINFTDDKNCGVFDTGQWQLRVSTPVGTEGVFERPYHTIYGTSFCDLNIVM
jgi:hypothetical protein